MTFGALRRAAIAASWLGALLAVSPASAAVATYAVTPSNLRSVAQQVQKSGQPAVITCAPGVYPQFIRGGPNFAAFKAPVVLKCAGATFPYSTLDGVTNLTVDGGTFTGRLVFTKFSDVKVRNLIFPQGSGVMARMGSGLLVENLSIQSSGAAITLGDVKNAVIRNNVVTDFSGNAGISAYGGGDVKILNNIVTGWREVQKGVHPDAIQTAEGMTGTVEISGNTVIMPGQGIFAGGTPDLFIARNNIIFVDFPNALTWKSRQPAQVSGNTIRKLPSVRGHSPRLFNYGTREGLASAAPGGKNDVLGKAVEAR